MKLNWDVADRWKEIANKSKDEYTEPTWEWDCSFKLNFDGPIISLSSRFYPPYKNRSDLWEGTILINLLGVEILRKEFKTNTIDDLKEEMEKFFNEYSQAIKQCLSAERVTQELRKLGVEI